MKRIVLISSVVLFFVGMPAQGQAPANRLEGTWQMVSQREVYPDTILVTKDIPHSLKVLNSTHFAWGYQATHGEDVLAGGGRYDVLDDSVYIEHIQWHTSPVLVGMDIHFHARVVGDSLWYHTRIFPTGYRLKEVRRRIR